MPPVYIIQVFVANPKKPLQIENILQRNKEKLLVFLQNFHNDKEGKSAFGLMSVQYISIFPSDEQFTDEKQFLIVQIQGL